MGDIVVVSLGSCSVIRTERIFAIEKAHMKPKN